VEGYQSPPRLIPKRKPHTCKALKEREPAGIGLAAVVPTVFVLMPPATARSFAFPTPHAGTAFRTRRPARNALLAAYVVPSAIVAATVVGSYRRREAFCCGSVSSRPDRRRQRRPGGKNAHREESKSCIECLHKRTPFRFRQWIRATTACTWRSLRMWVSAFVVRLGKYSFVHRSPDAGLGRLAIPAAIRALETASGSEFSRR
jgi:hypothetical protein